MRLWRVFVFVKICCLSVCVAAAILVFLRFFAALSWRAAEQRLFDFRSRFLQRMCRLIVLVFGIRVSFEASEAHHDEYLDSKTPRLILANHVSYLDIILIASKRQCIFLAKDEVRRWPVIGFIAQGLGCEFVDRNSLSSKVATLRKIRSKLTYTSVCVFPEGTTSAATFPSRLHWQEGQMWSAQVTGKPVELFSLHYMQHAAMVWIDEMSFLPHFWKLLAMPKIEVAMSSANRLPNQQAEPQGARVASRQAYTEVSAMCHKSVAKYRFSQDSGRSLQPNHSGLPYRDIPLKSR